MYAIFYTCKKMRQFKIGEEERVFFVYIALTRGFIYITFFDPYIGGQADVHNVIFSTSMHNRCE